MPVLHTTERLVKCPTPHCPGWITVDAHRPQTVPCRYCRVTVHTLAYLLGQAAVAARPAGEGTGVDLQDPALHAVFNDLVLGLAGTTGGNVYLRPTDRALVTLIRGPRGVVIEYHATLAGRVDAAALIGMLMHWLLHIDLHPRTERMWRAEPKPGGRQDLGGAVAYLQTLVDHVWLEPLMDAQTPGVRPAMQAWGLDAALMLAGGESFFPTFLRDRARREIAALCLAPDLTAGSMRAALVERLAELATAHFGQEREELYRIALALQIADLRLRNPAAATAFVGGLEAHEALNVREALPLADRLERNLADARAETPPGARPDANAFRRGLDEALKALNLHTTFEIRAVKAE